MPAQITTTQTQPISRNFSVGIHARPHCEPQGRARHSVRAATALSQARRARSDAPYHQGLVQGFKARMLSGNSHPGPSSAGVELRVVVGKRQARRAAMFIVPRLDAPKLRRSAMLTEHSAPTGIGHDGLAMAINIALLRSLSMFDPEIINITALRTCLLPATTLNAMATGPG